MRLTPYLALLATTMALTNSSAADPLLLITSFAPGDQGAIHAYRLDLGTGVLTHKHRTGGVEHPFFLALSPNHKYLYSIHAKQFSGKEDEHVAAFALDGRTGELKFLNRESSRGTASCYLDVDRTGKMVLVANYTSGSVAALPIQADGSLAAPSTFQQHTGSSVNPNRQKEPHAHCFVVSPDNRYAFAADLGTDQIFAYKLDPEKGTFAANSPAFARSPAGAGPRHLTFHPNKRQMYVINELFNSITVFDYDANTGGLTDRQTLSTLPKDFQGTSYCADVKVSPGGHFVYGTNRGHDSIAVFKVNEDSTLTLVEIVPSRGKGPQNLAITPDGRWLVCANMPGNSVAVFRIHAETGRLTPAGDPIEHLSPSCIMLVPAQ